MDQRLCFYLLFYIPLSLAIDERNPNHWFCEQHWDQVGAHFNLDPLILHGDGFNYNVKDVHDIPERNYTYVFNICSDVGHLPSELCKNEKDPEAGLAPAYQLSDTHCVRLASHVVEDANWNLLDEDDPSLGVELQYTGGEWCHHAKVYRTMSLRFICSAEVGLPSFETERVIEDGCHYSVEVETMFGCPTECGIGPNRELCSKNGFCGFDTDLNHPKCFCYSGWTDSDCSIEILPQAARLTSLGILLIFVNIFLFGLLVAGMYAYFKVRKLRRVTAANETALFSLGNSDN